MGKTFFEAIGYRLGKKAAQVKNAFELMGGTDEESVRAEIRLGRDLAKAFLQRIPLIEDNDKTRFTVQVGEWLAGGVTEKKLAFTFCVTAEDEPKALGLPGGPVFVSWPMLELCQWQRDQIAFVLGHEMAHIVRRHALDKLLKDAALSLLLKQASTRSGASAWLSKVGQQALGGAYSRAEEFEADAFAVALVGTAGGNGSVGERLLESLAHRAEVGDGGLRTQYFAAHPPFDERLAQLRGSAESPREPRRRS